MTQTEVRPSSTASEAGASSSPVNTGTNTTARTLAVVAFVCAGIALFFLPPVFGIAGIICASIAMAKGDSLGKWALGASVLALIVGMVLSYVVLRAHGHG